MKKNIFLTGPPSSGKTTVIKKVIKEVDMASDLMKAMFGKMQPESGPESGLESEVDYRILSILKTAVLSRSEIDRELGHKSVSGAVNRAITRLLEHNFIEYTIPEKPQSRLQKYRLTQKGQTVLSQNIEKTKHRSRVYTLDNI